MKKTLFSLILLGITYLMLEMLALAAYFVKYGNYSLYELQTGKQAVIEAANNAGVYVTEELRGEDKLVKPILHPYFGFSVDGKQRKPGCTSESEQDCYQRIRVASDRPFPKRTPERIIVGILGGSFAEGTSRHAEGAFVRIFKQYPELKGRDVIIIGMAGGAFKQPQQLTRLAWYYALGAEFDFVINLDGFNELGGVYYNYRNAQLHPTFPVSWNHRVAKQLSQDKLALYVQRKIESDRHVALARLSLLEGLRYSPIFNFFWRLSDQRSVSGILQLNQQIAVVDVSDNRDFRYEQTGPDFSAEDDEALFKYASAIWRDSSLAIKALAEGRGARYFHFLQPNQYIPGNKILSDWEQSNALLAKGNYGNVYRNARGYLVNEIPRLEAARLNFYDLTFLFSEVQDTLYVDNCCHMNSKGYTRVAEEMAQKIATYSSSPAALGQSHTAPNDMTE